MRLGRRLAFTRARHARTHTRPCTRTHALARRPAPAAAAHQAAGAHGARVPRVRPARRAPLPQRQNAAGARAQRARRPAAVRPVPHAGPPVLAGADRAHAAGARRVHGPACVRGLHVWPLLPCLRMAKGRAQLRAAAGRCLHACVPTACMPPTTTTYHNAPTHRPHPLTALPWARRGPTAQELGQHKADTHPRCQFCRTHFYGVDELYAHVSAARALLLPRVIADAAAGLLLLLLLLHQPAGSILGGGGLGWPTAGLVTLPHPTLLLPVAPRRCSRSTSTATCACGPAAATCTSWTTRTCR